MDIPPIVTAAVQRSKLITPGKHLAQIVGSHGPDVLVDPPLRGCPPVDQLECRSRPYQTDNVTQRDEAPVKGPRHDLAVPFLEKDAGRCIVQSHAVQADSILKPYMQRNWWIAQQHCEYRLRKQ